MSTPKSYWRCESAKVLKKVFDAYPGVTDRKQMKKIISKHYPFGERNRWPYKIWLSEVRKWLDVFYGPDKQEPVEDLPLFKN